MSVHEDVIAAFATHLEGTTGAYPPDRVVRVPAFHAGCLSEGLTTVYALVPVRVETKPVNISLGMEAILTVDLGIATKFNPASEDPFTADTPLRWTVQADLEADAKKRICSNYNLLGAAGAHRFSSVPVTDYASDLTYLKGWAVVFLRVLLRYTHADTTP